MVNGAPAQGVSAGLLARWTHACRMAKFWVTCLDALALPGQCRCAECAPGWLAAHQTSSAHGAVTSGVAFDGEPEPAVTAGVFAPSAAQLGALFRSAGKGNLKHANSDCCNTGCLRKRDPKSARMTASVPNFSLRVRNSAKRRGSYLLSVPQPGLMSRSCAAHGVIDNAHRQGTGCQQLAPGAPPELTRVKQRWGDDGSPRRAAD